MGRKAVVTSIPDRVRSGPARPADSATADDPDDAQEELAEPGADDAEEWEKTTDAEPADEVDDAPAPPQLPPDEPVAPDAGSDDPPVATPEGAAEEVTGTRVQRSLDVLINTIPGEILVLWAAFEGAAQLHGLPEWAYWTLLAITAIATPVYVYRSIDRPEDASTGFNAAVWEESNVRWQSLSATGAFLVWVYYLGGPFQAAGLQDAAVATVLVLIYPVLIVISPFYGSLVLYYVTGSTPGGDGEAGVA